MLGFTRLARLARIGLMGRIRNGKFDLYSLRLKERTSHALRNVDVSAKFFIFFSLYFQNTRNLSTCTRARAEKFTVGCGRNAIPFSEKSPHPITVSHATTPRDLVDGKLGFDQHCADRFEA